MFIDARTLSNETQIQSDVCIVGAGAAGITLAREFIGESLEVCLLESGGLDLDGDTQSLYRGEIIGYPYYPLDTVRLRYFGGTTNHWAGACRPLDEIDFSSRPWVPYSGWPFDKSHLDQFYRRAHAIVQLGSYDYDPKTWESEESPRLPIIGDRVATAMYQVSPPTRFGKIYREEIKRAQNISTFLYANVVEIEANASARSINRLRVTSFQGNKFSVTARVFILATGAIENPRLLLASNKIRRKGLGNETDLVGRFFMEHLSIPGALFLPSDPSIRTGLYEEQEKNGAVGKGYLILTHETLRREEILNLRAFVMPTSPEELSHGVSGWKASAKAIFDAVRRGNLPNNFAEHLSNVITDIDEVAISSYRKTFRPAKGAFSLYYHLENAPDPDSRIALTSERDVLGMRRVQLSWRFGDLERQTLRRANEIIGQELGRAGLGRINMVGDDTETGWPPGLRGAWHQMGTTRMHTDPKQGVVDEECRVHGLKNLFIAGSSVFPTSGYTNPTLTIVALAIRLADHIKREMI